MMVKFHSIWLNRCWGHNIWICNCGVWRPLCNLNFTFESILSISSTSVSFIYCANVHEVWLVSIPKGWSQPWVPCIFCFVKYCLKSPTTLVRMLILIRWMFCSVFRFGLFTYYDKIIFPSQKQQYWIFLIRTLSSSSSYFSFILFISFQSWIYQLFFCYPLTI